MKKIITLAIAIMVAMMSLQVMQASNQSHRYRLSKNGWKHLERIVPAKERKCSASSAEAIVNDCLSYVAMNEENTASTQSWNQDWIDAMIILTVKVGTAHITETETFRRMNCCRSKGGAVDYLDYRFTAAAIRDVDVDDAGQAMEIYKIAIYPADRWKAGDKKKAGMFCHYKQTRYPEHVSKEYVERLKRHERCSLVAYEDGGTKEHPRYSIGWGHNGAKKGQRITQKKADELLVRDIAAHEMYVKRAIERITDDGSIVSQELFDALVDLSYNAGPGSFCIKESTGQLNPFWHQMRKGNFDNHDHVRRMMAVYRRYHIYYRGEKHQGLIRRRDYHAKRVEEAQKQNMANR